MDTGTSRLWRAVLAAATVSALVMASPLPASASASAGPGGRPGGGGSEGGSAPAAVLDFAAEEGAHPLGGRSGHWADPEYEVRVWEHENIIKIDAATPTGWDPIRIELYGPDGTPLRRGTYRDVGFQHEQPGQAGILVIFGGLACRPPVAAFRIDRIERDAEQRLTALDARLVHRCASDTAPALRARIHFRA